MRDIIKYADERGIALSWDLICPDTARVGISGILSFQAARALPLAHLIKLTANGAQQPVMNLLKEEVYQFLDVFFKGK